eukprot:497357_1
MPKDTALHKSAYKGDMVGVEVALDEEFIDINTPGAQKRTALMRAAGANHVDMVSFLLSRGANPKQIDQSGRSPLHWAAASGAFESAEVISKHEIDFNAKTKSGSAPIHLVAECGKMPFLKLLIEKNVDTIDVDGDGKSPYQLAKEKGHKEAMILLKPEGEGCACHIM